MPSGESARQKMIRLLALSKADVYCDLGSGNGALLFEAARFPVKRIFGLEQSVWLCTWTRLHAWIKKINIELFNAQIPEFKLTQVPNRVSLFLMPKLFPLLEPFFSTLPKGALVVSNMFPLTNSALTLITEEPDASFTENGKIYLYKKT